MAICVGFSLVYFNGQPLVSYSSADGSNQFLFKKNVDPSACSDYLLTTASEYKSLLNSSMEPFDYSLAASFWGFAFVSTLALWLVAKHGGLILNLIRR